MTMRIVFFDYVCEPTRPGASGLSDIVWNTAARLLPYGDDVTIVGPYAVDTYPVPGIRVHTFPIPPVGYRNILGHMLIVLNGCRLLQQMNSIDVLHTHEYLSSGLLPLFVRSAPVVLTTPGSIHLRMKSKASFDPVTDRVFQLTSWLSAKLCKKIIAVSGDIGRAWQSAGADPSKIVVIPHGVDTNLYRPVPHARQVLGVDDKARIILHVGRLHPSKGLSFLLQATAILVPRHRTLQVHFLGAGPQQAELEGLAVDLNIANRVFWHDHVESAKLPTWYSAADVTVMPSLYEGMPRVMLEALSCGSPFVATPVSGVVDHLCDGQTGFFVEQRDPDDLAEKLDLLLTDREVAVHVGSNARKYSKENLDWSVVIKRIRQEVYGPLAGLDDSHMPGGTISKRVGQQ